ncbi:MAG: archemetzincin [Ignavibacteriales bacterium]|nr:MAG: archemetzincin [Ignavibacteriales bacterium]
MKIHLAPVRFTNSALLAYVKKDLSHIFSEVDVAHIDINIDEAYSKEREQYFSTLIIAETIKKTELVNGKFIILTDVDLYIPVLTFIFGEAQLNGKHSIVSVCRLHEEFYSGTTDEHLLRIRTMKEVLHELGHNFGLKHCINWDCVMHSSTNIEEVDIKGKFYCIECENKIKFSHS